MMSKNARVDIKTTADAKHVLEKAAHSLGTTLSAFMIDSSLARARDILIQSQMIELNAKEANKFLEIIQTPPLPNAKLKALFKKHGCE